VQGSRKEATIQECMYRDTTNVEPEMLGYTSNYWSNWKSYKRFPEKFGSFTRKTLNRITKKESYTSNFTCNTECTAV